MKVILLSIALCLPLLAAQAQPAFPLSVVVPDCVITGLVIGQPVYVAVVNYNSNRVESDFSVEVAVIATNDTLQVFWDAPTDPSVIGQFVYYGDASRMYTNKLEISSVAPLSKSILYFKWEIWVTNDLTTPMKVYGLFESSNLVNWVPAPAQQTNTRTFYE